MKQIITLLIISTTIYTFTEAQNDRIEKDLNVTKTILKSLLEDSDNAMFRKAKGQLAIVQGNSGFRWRGDEDDIRASFSNNYGAIFTVNVHDNFVFYSDDDKVVSKYGSENMEQYELVAKEFLADYGYLLRDLNDDHKVMIRFKSDEHYDFGFNDRVKPSVGVEVVMADINALYAGDIERETFMDRVTVKAADIETTGHASFGIFAKVIEENFTSRTSRSYYMTSRPSMEYVEGLGLSYDIKVYSSNQYNKYYSMPTIDRKDVTNEERNELVEDLYPVFIEDFKTVILDYGIILKEISEDEPINFNINLTRCECDIPREIVISTTKKIIDEYREGSLGLSAAMDQINVSKT